MEDLDKRIEFLKEYKTLCEKYNLTVNSCGCCNSPWITGITKGYSITEHILHLLEQMEVLVLTDELDLLGKEQYIDDILEEDYNKILDKYIKNESSIN